MAMFNGGFPASYSPMYYQPQFQPTLPQQPAQTQSNGIIWVQGEAGAKSYMVAPNTTVQLWDSESQRIFLKSADASGMPSMKVLDYTIRDQSAANAPVSAAPTQTHDYATHAEINALAARIDALKAELDGMTKEADKA